MKKTPLILIVPSTDPKGVEFSDRSLSLSQKYPEAILAAGGLPWIFPCIPDGPALAEAVRRSAGVMLTGGDDLMPGWYARRLPPAVRPTVKTTAPPRSMGTPPATVAGGLPGVARRCPSSRRAPIATPGGTGAGREYDSPAISRCRDLNGGRMGTPGFVNHLLYRRRKSGGK